MLPTDLAANTLSRRLVDDDAARFVVARAQRDQV